MTRIPMFGLSAISSFLSGMRGLRLAVLVLSAIVLFEEWRELFVQLEVALIRLGISRCLCIWWNDCSHAHHGIAALLAGGQHTARHPRKDGIAQQGSVVICQRHDLAAAYISLDLVPKRAAGPASRRPDLMDRDPRPLDGFNVLAQEKGYALQQRAHKMPARMREGKSRERTACQRIRFRAERAHQVRQHGQA